ncbi:hypothetical protein TEA_022541 [Camellia sinensis var. sinensis]|uniref:S-protein homolog n=1 Tax=Camellia sinensis var. sinensis TaxID=542762 RepID=A0A4S4D4G2_CAMSN|nr:hypothetical protein TEA_022541 [Camellia sinensis var. sinensis]
MGCLIKALMETAKLEVHDPLRSNHINESKDDKISMDSIKEASSVFLLSFGLLLMLLKRFEVHVISEVPDTPSQLKIHCKSSDKDLGVQLNNGQDFRWSLRENFFGTILYFCRFWWNTLERHCQRQEELWLCVWSVRPDGFYLGNVQGKKSIDHISFANFGYFKGPAEASVDVVMFLGIQISDDIPLDKDTSFEIAT